MLMHAEDQLMDLEGVERLYEKGLYLQAYAAGMKHAPLERWSGIKGRTLAGRLAWHLGGEKLSRALFLLAYRENRGSPEALFYYVTALMERRGPLSAWDFLAPRADLQDALAEDRADWYGLHTIVLSNLRDFDRAEAWLRRAEELAPRRPWVRFAGISLCFASDRIEAAHEAGRRALEI